MTVCLEDIEDVLTNAGEWAHGHEAARYAAGWFQRGFTPPQVQAWLDARCYDPDSAAALRDAGIIPSDVAEETPETIGVGGYADTLGYKFANNDIGLDVLRRLIPA